jgi:hypothetical protein
MSTPQKNRTADKKICSENRRTKVTPVMPAVVCSGENAWGRVISSEIIQVFRNSRSSGYFPRTTFQSQQTRYRASEPGAISTLMNHLSESEHCDRIARFFELQYPIGRKAESSVSRQSFFEIRDKARGFFEENPRLRRLDNKKTRQR